MRPQFLHLRFNTEATRSIHRELGYQIIYIWTILFVCIERAVYIQTNYIYTVHIYHTSANMDPVCYRPCMHKDSNRNMNRAGQMMHKYQLVADGFGPSWDGTFWCVFHDWIFTSRHFGFMRSQVACSRQSHIAMPYRLCNSARNNRSLEGLVCRLSAYKDKMLHAYVILHT